MRDSYLFTSESVSEGHPDKVADQISDAIVDLFLSKDPESRVACETMVTTQRIVLSGEIRCRPVYDEDGGRSYRTSKLCVVVSDPHASNQSMPSLTRSNFNV